MGQQGFFENAIHFGGMAYQMPDVPIASPDNAAETRPDLLSQQIADHLRTLIATDEMVAGQRLRERALAAQLQVSRTPLREALKILAGDGLVTLLPNRGAIVTAPTPQEIQEKLDVLALIEGHAGRLAAAHASEAELAEIRALHHDMMAAYERRDRRGYFGLNQRIHAGIVAASANRTLAEMHARLNRQLIRYRFQGSVDADTWAAAVAEHGHVVELLAARRGAELDAAMRQHVSSTWQRIRPEIGG